MFAERNICAYIAASNFKHMNITLEQLEAHRLQLAEAALNGTPLCIGYRKGAEVVSRQIVPFAFGKAHNGSEIVLCWKFDAVFSLRSYDVAAITSIEPGNAPKPDEPLPAAPRFRQLYAMLQTI
jgi:hypothetical protein